MNFKDEYKRDFASIHLDEDFKKGLADKMNEVTPARNNIRIYATVLAAAAALAIVIGIGHFGNVNKEGNIGVKAENATMVTAGEGIFVAEKWYKEAVTDEEIYAEFARLMESGTLEKLYCSDAESFSDEDILKGEDANALANQLASAVQTDSEFVGTTKNYMAVFENGEIIKFRVSDEGYVQLNDIKAVYRYEK